MTTQGAIPPNAASGHAASGHAASGHAASGPAGAGKAAASAASAAPSRAPVRQWSLRWRFGLSGKLLLLTILFVMIAEIAIYVPSIANFRNNWLRDRLAAAHTAALVLDTAPSGMVADDLARRILDSVGARAEDLIGTWVLALSQRLNIRAMATPVVPYPTYGEIGKRAAMSFFTPRLTGSAARRIIRWLGKFG